MLQAQHNKYLQNSVQTATPAQLLIMLYDGSARYCRLAIDALQNQRLEDAHQYLGRVQDIIKELIITLERKSEVAENLFKLYDYFLFRLIEANTRKTVEPVQEVLAYLVELKETWVQAAKLAHQGVGAQHG